MNFFLKINRKASDTTNSVYFLLLITHNLIFNIVTRNSYINYICNRRLRALMRPPSILIRVKCILFCFNLCN